MSTPPVLDPLPIRNLYRAQVVLQGPSGMPEDRFVNVFHFRDRNGAEESDPTPARKEFVADAIADKVQSFYTATTVGGAQFPVTNYLSRLAIDEAVDAQVRVYHHGDAEPREPVVREFPLGTLSPETTAVLPNEAAVTISFYATRNIPKHRGRAYIGPLGANAIAEDPIRGDLKVAELFRLTLADACIRMATPTTDLFWVVYSPTDSTERVITNGWIDDALDTQRRRGVRPTQRLSWEVSTSFI